jgi:hypothetical protein
MPPNILAVDVLATNIAPIRLAGTTNHVIAPTCHFRFRVARRTRLETKVRLVIRLFSLNLALKSCANSLFIGSFLFGFGPVSPSMKGTKFGVTLKACDSHSRVRAGLAQAIAIGTLAKGGIEGLAGEGSIYLQISWL